MAPVPAAAVSTSSALHSGSSAFAAGRRRQPSRAHPAGRALRLSSTAAAQTTAAAAAAATTTTLPVVVPATLPGTPAPGTSFPFTAEQLITKAKEVHALENGILDDSVLADDFRFEFPIIKLERAEFLKTVRGFTFKQGIPNLSPNAYDFRVDPYEPNRVWFTIRTTGTHTGPFTFGRTSIPATGNTIQGPPECCSYTFNAEGKVTSFTGGYVMDNRVGNTDGYGAAFGVLAACGIKVPKPNSLQWEVATKLNGLFTAMDKMFGKK